MLLKNYLLSDLENLISIIRDFCYHLISFRFMFIPGPSDPGSAVIYPRPPLPSHLTKDLKVVNNDT